jgi:5'-3' exonuclease
VLFKNNIFFLSEKKMGIPGFFGRWLRNVAKKAIFSTEKISGGRKNRRREYKVSSLSIDLNGVIHRAKELINNQKMEVLSQQDFYSQMFEVIIYLIDYIIDQFTPEDLIVIAIDGVPPLAKMNQQRQRRFLSEAPTTNKFDGNAITPGTEFMMQLDLVLQKHFRYRLNAITGDTNRLNVNFIYSSHLTAGEGEHKIADIYRNSEIFGKWYEIDDYDKKFHVLYGLDADLIMLALLSPVKNIMVVRENNDEGVNVETLKDQITLRMNKVNQMQAIRDFVFLSFLLGNDFLPSHSFLLDKEHDFELLIDTFILLNKDLVNDKGDIDHLVLQEYFNSLAYIEKNKMVNLITSSNDEIFRKSINVDGNFDYNLFRKLWLSRALFPLEQNMYKHWVQKIGFDENMYSTDDQIKEMSINYLLMLQWNFQYYHSGKYSDLIYRYSYPPLFYDLSKIKNSQNFKLSWINETSLTVAHQMIAVLPPWSYYLLPPFLAPLVNDPDGPLFDFQIRKFKILDHEYSHARKPILPFIDKIRLVSALSLVDINYLSIYQPRKINFRAFDFLLIDEEDSMLKEKAETEAIQEERLTSNKAVKLTELTKELDVIIYEEEEEIVEPLRSASITEASIAEAPIAEARRERRERPVRGPPVITRGSEAKSTSIELSNYLDQQETIRIINALNDSTIRNIQGKRVAPSSFLNDLINKLTAKHQPFHVIGKPDSVEIQLLEKKKNLSFRENIKAFAEPLVILSLDRNLKFTFTAAAAKKEKRITLSARSILVINNPERKNEINIYNPSDEFTYFIILRKTLRYEVANSGSNQNYSRIERQYIPNPYASL